jgi:hypothetical protein
VSKKNQAADPMLDAMKDEIADVLGGLGITGIADESGRTVFDIEAHKAQRAQAADPRAAAGWAVNAHERTDDRKGKRYRRHVRITIPAPALGEHDRIDYQRLAADLRAALRDDDRAPRVTGVDLPSTTPWGPKTIGIAIDLVAEAPRLIVAEADAAIWAWHLVVPVVAHVLDAALLGARERGRRTRAIKQAQQLAGQLAHEIAEKARERVDVERRVAVIMAEAETEAVALARAALVGDGVASEANLASYDDGTAIEPEAAAYVRRVLVERAANVAGRQRGGLPTSMRDLAETEVFPPEKATP